MSFIKIGNRILNTDHIASVELHYEQPAFDTPDIEPAEGENRPSMIADLVRVHVHGHETIIFYHDEAKALREYFTDEKNIIEITKKETAGDVGFR